MAIVAATLVLLSVSAYAAVPENCGYESCHPVKEDYVNVHIVPHTHDDVGWLKTVDQYYYGSKSDIQKAGVQYILDSVLASLKHDKNRRFIYVETAFLWKWWKQQHDTTKHQFIKLIRNGQLELIGGAWSMNDEATTHYQSIIDQFTWGLRKLNATFGHCGRPKIGWQIDPFGHSREMASIFSQLGYDGLFLGRIDYQDKKFRLNTKTMEMIWRSSENLGNSSDIFTGFLYNTYSPPPGFCFDILCSDEPIIDDKKSPDYNVPKRVSDFLKYVEDMAKSYTSHNVLVTMGEDFTYQDAHLWFKNLDKLIYYSNQLQANGSRYNLLYSTPSCYLKAVHNEAKKNGLKYSTKTDDFFPYASDPHSYWTGYFTSKPTIKRFERLGNNFLQICKQLYALTDLGPEDWADLNVMREAMGVLQHHDAVTGTEKEHVAHDYARILTKGFDECHFTAATALGKLVTKNSVSDPAPAIQFESCLLTNISQCAFSENNDQFVVTVYNPLSREVDHYVRLPVTNGQYKVTDGNGINLQVQTIPVADTIAKIPGRLSNATQEIIFIAESIPPLGFKSFYIQKTQSTEREKMSSKFQESAQVKIDKDTGLISKIYTNGREVSLQQNFFYYRGSVGDNEVPENRSSGAYIFRPNGTDAFNISNKALNRVYEGDLVTEIHQIFNDWVSQIVRIYKTESFVEFDWLIGPIPRERRFRSRRIVDEIAFDKRLVVRGSHYLVAGPYVNNNGIKSLAAQERDLAQKKLLQAWTFLSPTNGLNYDQYKAKYTMKYSGLKKALPDNVHILTLEPWIGSSYLLRLEHYLEKNDDPILSKPVTVDLKEIFSAFDIIAYKETTLGANQWLEENRRLSFNVSDQRHSNDYVDDRIAKYLMNDTAWMHGVKYWKRSQIESNKIDINRYLYNRDDENRIKASAGFQVVLNPMQIRTFVIDIKMLSNKK
ncbi:hypothetical protein FQR65_LT01599 [Abscondita terminalis]|nr:hypothetical protein FQR65_LT01599 [Abscondita terminalis]